MEILKNVVVYSQFFSLIAFVISGIVAGHITSYARKNE
jgi:hypothetical protein